MKVAIIGMGNTLLSDDGVGIVIADRLSAIFDNDDRVFVTGTAWGGLRLIDLLSGYDHAIIIDAIQTGCSPLGTIHTLTPSDLLHSIRMVSFHDVNLTTTLKFARRLGIPMPQKISIYAVEVAEITRFGETFTPAVNDAVDGCVRKILRKTRRVLGKGPQNPASQRGSVSTPRGARTVDITD